jgi:hypothetical protein
MAIKFGSCFELAFRRALFAFLLLISYLAAGTIILYVLVQIDSSYEERRVFYN